MLVKDVYRTFSDLHMFTENPNTGHNKLFNVLKAYSLYDEDVGYTQGMGFIAALVIYVLEDEALAWTAFVKILNICEWRKLYLESTPKLFELTKTVRTFVNEFLPRLYKQLLQHNIILESLFASPFLTLFSNLISID